MWLPLSKMLFKPITLAICRTGVALALRGEKPQLLTNAAFEWKDTSQLSEILADSENVIKNQNVKVVLSNTFARYLVLPWQDGVLMQADWQAIAQHEFRKQFGAIADDWLVGVSLGKHGQTVLAAAMDNKLYAQLQASSEQLAFKIEAIEPLLITLLNRNSASTWTLLAEPQRLVLCTSADGEWKQVLVDSPPLGQEYAHAEKLIQRSLLQLETTAQPSKIATFVSAALTKIWQDNIGSRQKLMLPLSSAQSHATWMAGLSLNKQTQKVQLYFARKSQTKTKLGDVILLLAAISVAAFLWINYQQTQAKISTLEQQAAANLMARPIVKPDAAVADKLKIALQVQQQLNLPWMPMLAALEEVKKANPNIEFINISPNKNRSEIKLNGEATAFADITQLLNDLRANAAFSDAALVNQHLEQDADKPKSQIIYVFEINLGWRV